MLADEAQLERWRQLLAVPADGTPGDVGRLLAKLRTAKGRPLLLAAVDAATRFDAVMDDLRRTPATADDAATLKIVPTAGTRFVDVVRNGLRDLPSDEHVFRQPAARGQDVAAWVWLAYVKNLYSDPIDGSLALRIFIDTLDPTALVFTPDDNPEPWWQAEMIILHALHSFALRSRDRTLIDKTLACADFHLREIQPDHATNEPWAVHAYASHADGNVTAETLWHAAYIQHGGVPGPVARMLAAEASTSLATWLGR